MSPVLSAGVDTYTLSADPAAVHNGEPILVVAPSAAKAYVYLPVTGVPLNATLTGATLRLYTNGSWAVTATVTAKRAAAAWGASTLTWDTAPATTGTTVTSTRASSGDADEWAFDVTTQVSAMLSAGANYGWEIARTDAFASREFYSHEHETFAPSLELTWAVTPDPPINVSPSNGNYVATTKPVVSFDALDVTAVQVQVDALADDFSSPQFDSGTVVSDIPELDLSATAYVGLDNLNHLIRVRYKNSSGVWSAWSDPVEVGYRIHQTVTLTNPSADTSWIATSDTPTITATSTGTVASYHLTVATAADPYTALYDMTVASSTIETTLPVGVITDSSDMILTLEVFDDLDREAVPGFPIASTVTQTFTFSGTAAVPPVDSLFVRQVGSSPFNELAWRRNHVPDKWQIRRDGRIVASVDADDVERGDDDLFRWIDYTASGGTVHHYRVAPKVNNEVAADGPTFDIVTQPRHIYVGDPYINRQLQVRILGTDSGSWTQGEVGATYTPLRGKDAVHITQSQRGYEGSITGVIFGDHETNGLNDIDAMRAIRHIPNRDYVIALPYLSFVATIFNVTIAPTPAPYQQFSVSFDFVQQGSTLWEGAPVYGESRLLASYDYEEGTDGAAVTTVTNVGAASIDGAPKYKAAAALHGDMGFTIPATGAGGAIVYPIPRIGIAQIYFTPRVSTDVGNLCKLTGSASPVSQITMRTAGDFGINDAADANMAKSNAIYRWQIGVPTRVQILWAWSTGTITIIIRLFGSIESTLPVDQFSATFPAVTAPTLLHVGNGTDKKATDYDSVSIYAGNESWPPPVGGAGDDVVPVWSLPGWPTSTAISVQSMVTAAETVPLAYSTTLSGTDPASPTYTSAANVDPTTGLVRHSLTGLTAATRYYAKLSPEPGVFVGDLVSFKTLPAANTAFTTKIVVGSCQQNPGGSVTNIGWVDALAYAPDLHWHLGDLGYFGGGLSKTDDWTVHLGKYSERFVGLPAMRQLMAQTSSCYLGDDHEFSPNNGESNASTDTGQVRAVSIRAMQEVFPMYPLADTRAKANKRGLYGTAMLGSHVRLIWLDGESLDRSLGTDTDSSSKSFIGTEQETWLRNLLIQPAVVNVIITGKSLLGSSTSASNSDKPWAYPTWRSSLATYINGTQTTDSKPISVVWVGGDRHANAYCTKIGNPVMPGHPTIIASGWEQHSLPRATGETYTVDYGFDDNKQQPVVQYVQMTIADNNGSPGSGVITMTFKSRETHNTWSGGAETDPAGWTVVDGWGGVTKTDTWTY